MTDEARKQAQQRTAIDQMLRAITVEEIDPRPAEGEHDEPLLLLTLLPGAWRDRITVRAWG